MNNWCILNFKQLSPFHIGKYNYGVLSETEIYIPGYTMWGALVNSYGLKHGGSDDIFDQAKEKFQLISCFYPYFDKSNILYPEYRNGDLYYGSSSEEELRRNLTDTYISTSILPDTKSAKDGSLHEMEIVLPKCKKDKRQVFWKGIIGLNSDDIINSFLLKGLEIIVGGDGRYGLGRLELDEVQKVGNDDLLEWQIDDDGFYQKNSGENNSYIKNYIEVDDVVLLEGKYKSLINLKFDNAVPKKNDDKEISLCFMPGSKIKTNNGKYRLNKGIFLKI